MPVYHLCAKLGAASEIQVRCYFLPLFFLPFLVACGGGGGGSSTVHQPSESPSPPRSPVSQVDEADVIRALREETPALDFSAPRSEAGSLWTAAAFGMSPTASLDIGFRHVATTATWGSFLDLFLQPEGRSGLGFLQMDGRGVHSQPQPFGPGYKHFWDSQAHGLAHARVGVHHSASDPGDWAAYGYWEDFRIEAPRITAMEAGAFVGGPRFGSSLAPRPLGGKANYHGDSLVGYWFRSDRDSLSEVGHYRGSLDLTVEFDTGLVTACAGCTGKKSMSVTITTTGAAHLAESSTGRISIVV